MRLNFTQLFSDIRFLWILLAFLLLIIIIQQFFLFSKNRKLRKDAVKRSRAVIGGQVVEQLAPYLPEFPCNPGDARFVGKPVDYVAFTGMTDGKCVEEVLLIEVKTGQSALSKREKEIKCAVEEGRVRYVEYRI